MHHRYHQAQSQISAYYLALSLFFFFLLLIFTSLTYARVELPSGEYNTRIDDLVVKVMGGEVKAQRTWYEGRWQFNRSWNRLQINRNLGTNAASALDSIERSGDKYTRSSGSSIAVFVNTVLVRKNQTITAYDTLAPDTVLTEAALQDILTTRANDLGYRWADRQGNVILYNAQGEVVEYRDRNAVSVKILYDGAGRRSGVADHFDTQVLWYEYDANGKLSSVRDHVDVAQARQVVYQWTNGELLTVTDVRGNDWQYSYIAGETVLLKSETDPEGRVTTIDYDTTQSVKQVSAPDGTTVSYEYDYDKTRKEYFVRLTHNSGKINENWYDKDGRIVRRDINGVTVETVVRDGRRHTYTDELGYQTVREVDEWDNLLRLTHPDKTYRTYTYDRVYSNVLAATDERGVTTKYEYDTRGNLVRRTDALGLAEQRITVYTPDAYGNVLDITRLSDALTEEARVSYTYDDMGNRKTRTTRVSGSESHTVNYDTYDRMGNILTWRDARNKPWQQTFNEKGQRASITDPLTQTTAYQYDGAGNLILITTADSKTTEYQISAKGQLDTILDAYRDEKRYIYNEKGQLGTAYDEENRATQLGYDNLGRVNQVIDGASNTITLEYGVVANRNVTQDRLGAMNYPTYRQEFNYDSRGRLRQEIDYLMTESYLTRRRDYDGVGNLTSTTDAEQKTTTYEYDKLNRLSNVIYPDTRTNVYTYDNRNNLLTVSNEKNIVIRRYQYDQKNRLTAEIWPGGETLQYFYDANDNLTRKVDGKGQVIVYAYDDANRLVTQTYHLSEADYQNNVTPVKTINYSYNARNRLIGYDDGQTSATYTLDDLQRKTNETLNFGAFSKTWSTTYYKNGLARTDTDAEGITRTYYYDTGNRISQISLPNEGSIIYNEYRWNQPKKITYPGGGTRNLTHDALMRIQQITALDPAQNAILDIVYTHDNVGNIKTRSTTQGTVTYGYDARYQLTRVDNPGSQADEGYTYDEAGNRLTDLSTPGAWTYNDANQLKAYGDISLDYDPNGSLTTKTEAGQTTTYLYNLDNRLSEVKDNSNATLATYYYDPFGRRLWKDVAGTRTTFMYANAGMVAEMDNTGAIIRSYGYAPQANYGASPLYQRSGTEYSYYQADHLDTPQQLIGKTGAVQWKGTAQAFGETTEAITIKSNKLRFPGQYYDSETGLHYNYYRYYDPRTGRYVTADPIGLNGGINVYAYVNNDPINYSDPSGLRPTQNPKGPDGKPVTHGCVTMCIANFVGSGMVTAAGASAFGALTGSAALWQVTGWAGNAGINMYSGFGLAACLDKCNEDEDDKDCK